MVNKKAGQKPDNRSDKTHRPRSRVRKASVAPPYDGGESVTGMEPMLISPSSSYRGALSDKVMAVTQRAAAFRSRLPEGLIFQGSGINLRL
jgi:hypothetical protein